MARFFLYALVLGGFILGMVASKPTKADYLRKLEDRAAAVATLDNDAFAQLRGGDPVDEMVATESATQLLEQTRIDDYVVFTVFTTQYHTPEYGTRQIQTYGLFSTLVSSRDD